MAERFYRTAEGMRRIKLCEQACANLPDAFLASGGIGRLIAQAEELAMREAEYRRCRDLLGAVNIETGRAWDLMRRAGDHVRALLAELPAGAAAEPEKADG